NERECSPTIRPSWQRGREVSHKQLIYVRFGRLNSGASPNPHRRSQIRASFVPWTNAPKQTIWGQLCATFKVWTARLDAVRNLKPPPSSAEIMRKLCPR